jgi:hypothetical protein|nr:MAG TPA: hypothetical protein [Caudoviricetes sp.]
MGNVLRDNKTILSKAVNIFSNAMEHRMSCIEVSFNGTITFIYKQFNYSFRLQGVRLKINPEDVKLINYRDKAVICIDTNNIFNYSRLKEDGLYYNGISDFMSIQSVLKNIGKIVWNTMYKTHTDLFKEYCNKLSEVCGSPCNDLDSFLKLFIKYNYPNMVSVLQDYISTLNMDNYMGRVSKTMYVQDGLIGVCCFNFKDNLVTSPYYSKTSMSALQVFTTSTNQLSIRLLNISSILTNTNKIDCEFLKLNLRISNNSQFMSDDGMIKLGVD